MVCLPINQLDALFFYLEQEKSQLFIKHNQKNFYQIRILASKYIKFNSPLFSVISLFCMVLMVL